MSVTSSVEVESSPEVFPKIVEPKRIVEEADLVDELAWGLSYRPRKAKLRRKSLSPSRSPVNLTTMWEKFVMAQEKREKLRNAPKPSPIHPKVKRPKVITPGDRGAMTHKQYIDFLSTPRKYFTPDWDKRPKKMLPPKDECNPRILELSAPDKKKVLGIHFQNNLSLALLVLVVFRHLARPWLHPWS